MRGSCGARLWLRRLPCSVRPPPGPGKDSTAALRHIPLPRLTTPPRRLAPRRDSRPGNRSRSSQPLRIKPGRKATRCNVPPPAMPLQVVVPAIRAGQIRARQIRARPIAARMHLQHSPAARIEGTRIQVRRPPGTSATGSISTAASLLRTRSGCCATTLTSTVFLPATNSG